PRQGWHEVSRGAAGGRGVGHPGRCAARAQDGGAAPGGDGVGGGPARPAAPGAEGRARRRQAAQPGPRRIDGHVEFPVLAVGHRRLAAALGAARKSAAPRAAAKRVGVALMTRFGGIAVAVVGLWAFGTVTAAGPTASAEAKYYKIVTLPVP